MAESLHIAATATATKVADTGEAWTLLNTSINKNTVLIALMDSTPDATTGWIPIKWNHGLKNTDLGDGTGNLWLKNDGSADGSISLSK